VLTDDGFGLGLDWIENFLYRIECGFIRVLGSSGAGICATWSRKMQQRRTVVIPGQTGAAERDGYLERCS
jgi:hypothetical protein